MFILVQDETKAAALSVLEESIKAGKTKQETIDAILDTVKHEIAKMARYDVFAGLKACPSCNVDTVTRGVVNDYFTCSSEWHSVKHMITRLMTPEITK